MSTSNFYHSGDLGDIIYSLPTMNKLGGGNLILGNNHYYKKNKPIINITQSTVNDLKLLLKDQKFIKNVLFDDEIKINYDLNKFRSNFERWDNNDLSVSEVNTLKSTNLVELTQNHFNLSGNLYLDKWLDCKSSIFLSNIIINRTTRYNNNNFPWQQIVDNFKNQITFLGHKDEHEKFVNDFGNVAYKKTNLNECLEILNGCKIYIGNQSFLYSLAEASKIPCLQETDTYIPNCLFFRKDSYLTNSLEKIKYRNIKSFIITQLTK